MGQLGQSTPTAILDLNTYTSPVHNYGSTLVGQSTPILDLNTDTCPVHKQTNVTKKCPATGKTVVAGNGSQQS